MAEIKISSQVKKSIEKQFTASLKGVDSLILINYSGVKAPDLSTLRDKLRLNKARLFIVKNSLSKRVLKDKKLEDLSNLIDGPTGIIFVQDDPVATSKVLVDFAKDHQSLSFKAGFTKDKVLSKVELETLSKLPSKEILRAKVVYDLKAPLNNLAMILNQVLRKPVLVIKAIAEKKQSQK